MTIKKPHCKICDHDHSGLCTECPKCRHQSDALAKSVKAVRMPRAPDPPVSNLNGYQQDVLDRLAALEERLDTMDSRRKYQREYMRQKRSEK